MVLCAALLPHNWIIVRMRRGKPVPFTMADESSSQPKTISSERQTNHPTSVLKDERVSLAHL